MLDFNVSQDALPQYVLMKTIKTLTILSLTFNALILIGAGHGFGPVIMVEVLSFSQNFIKDFEINLIGNYDEKIISFSIFNLIFQIILSISLFVKPVLKIKLINLSSILLILNLIHFTYDFTESNLSKFTIISGIPFLIIALILLFKINSIKTEID